MRGMAIRAVVLNNQGLSRSVSPSFRMLLE